MAIPAPEAVEKLQEFLRVDQRYASSRAGPMFLRGVSHVSGKATLEEIQNTVTAVVDGTLPTSAGGPTLKLQDIATLTHALRIISDGNTLGDIGALITEPVKALQTNAT